MHSYLELPAFSTLDLATFEERFDQLIKTSDAKVAVLEAIENPGWDNLFHELDLIEDEISRFFSPLRHLNAVLNNEEIRDVYNNCLPRLSAWSTDLGQNIAVYEKVLEIRNSDEFLKLGSAQKKSIEDSLLNFKLGGVALPVVQKNRFREISLELSKLGTRFQENVLDATKAWTKEFSSEAALAGFPRSALDSAKQAAREKNSSGYLLTLDYPSYHAVMTFADDRALREEVYFAFTTRASDQAVLQNEELDNAPIMEKIIQLRAEKADLLGFDSYADLSVATKMVKDPAQVLDFINELAIKATPSAKADYAQLSEFARDDIGIEDLQPWDIPYCSNKLKKKLFDFSEEDLKPYFPASVAIPGMFEVVGKIFGITIEEVTDADVWHTDVSLYQITDNQDRRRGAFFMDNYARTNKRGGAWMDVCVGRMQKQSGLQLPIAYLTCNLTPPVGDEPALLTHSELTTLFHEFGHGLHHMLTLVDVPAVAGISGVEWDAVELPSQFLENWCWQRESLDLLGKHYKTGEALPADLLEKARAARNYQSGMMTLRQLEFALFDMKLHLSDKTLDANAIQSLLDDVRAQVAVYKTPKQVRFQNGFSHIFAGGYAAGYFSYKWAEVLSCDAFGRFEEEGIFNQQTGAEFLSCILEKGGTQKAMELFVAFRGREPKIDALLRHAGLAA